MVFVNKYQMETCPDLPEWKLISPCNRWVKSVAAGRDEISSRQNGIMQSSPKYISENWVYNVDLTTGIRKMKEIPKTLEDLAGVTNNGMIQ